MTYPRKHPRHSVLRVPGRYIVSHWELYQPLLELARPHDRYDWDDDQLQQQLQIGVFEGVEISGHDKPVAIALCKSAVCFGAPALEVVTLAGTGFDRWGAKMMDGIERMAKDIGAQRILVEGRRGWEKKLAVLGFKTLQVVMTAEVNT